MAAAEDEELPFFVEALFPFVGTDASSLSFQRGDVIQVLNRLPSGWWDGLLDDDRGWFPSNYVRRILEAEAEEALTRREMERQHAEMQQQQQQQRQQQLLAHQQSQSHGQPQRTHVQDQYAHHNQNAYWDDRTTPAQDYWVPEVTDNGQIYYVNSLTGQHSRDLPTDDGVSDSHSRENGHPHTTHMAGANVPHIDTNVSHQHSTNGATMGYMIPGRQRSGTTNSQASSSRVDPISATTSHRPGQDLVGSYSSSAIGTAASGGAGAAGFGVMHRSETPEPWERRLTDDGMAYYYFNTITEEARWTRPEPHEGYPAQYGGRTSQQQGNYGSTNYGQTQFQQRGGAPAHGRNRTDSEASYSGRERDTRRMSVYSDDSEVSPLGKELRQGLHHAGDSMNTTGIATVRPWPTPGGKPEDTAAGTQANGIANPLQVALNLQAQMIPPPLPPLTLYSDKARDAIGAVVEAYVDSNTTTNDSTTSGSVASASTTDVSQTNPSSTSLEQGQPQAGPESAERNSIEAVRMQTMADRVALVVVAVRNLLYVSGTLTGSLPNLGGTALSNGHGIHHKGANAGGLNGVGLNGIGAGLAEDADWVRQEIKPYQRKVTATLSKLVLSARAVNANPDWPVGGRAGSSGRVESDAAELERAVTNFVYQIQRTAASSRAKRLQGVMLPGDGSAGIGVGLIGGGVGGNWKGAGFVPIGDSALGAPAGGPEIRLGREVVSELAGLKVATEEKMLALRTAVEGYKSALAVVTGESTSTGTYDSRAADLVILTGRLVVAQITDFLLHTEDVDISMGVDVMGTEDDDEAYLAGVKRARELIRTFETAKQALYDDGSVLLMASQAIHVSTLGTNTLTNATPTAKTGGPADVLLQTAIPAIQSNLGTMMETLELLLDIAHEQAVVQAQREPPIGYQDDIQYPYADGESHQGQYQRDPMYPDGAPSYSGDVNAMLEKMGIRGTRGDAQDETDMVDIGDALAPRGESRPPTGQRHAYVKGDPAPGARDSIDGGPAPSEITLTTGNTNGTVKAPSSIAPSLGESSTVVGSGSTTGPMDDDIDSDDSLTGKPKRKPGTSKAAKILGREVPIIHAEQQKQNAMPAYLRLDHASPTELITNPDGAVRAGTLPALIERLTMHSGTDARFTDTFMMTFKSFATIDQVFDLLVERYNMQPPDGLTPEQLTEWTRVKKTPIRLRSINIMRKLIDVLEREDLHILDRVKSFCNEVTTDPGIAVVAKTVLSIITRVETKGIESKRTMHATTSDFPPPSILPRKQGKFKLLDIDPLELARQLTIMESELFFKIKQSECIARSKESTPSGPDNIKSVITVTNKARRLELSQNTADEASIIQMADWVADAVLSKEDPRRRAAVIKHFINVAERCRYLNNYSSMAALIAGLNCPPIRRLKRTWEQVNVRNTAVLDDLERTLDTAHNFQGYKAIISSLQPPCVPFLGVYLTVLTFIQDGAKDTLKEGGLINFQKRQKTADVIQEITKFQMQPYNLTKLANIRAFIDESLVLLDNVPDFWQLSLEREPREREDEKMARLLQESGFL